MPVDLTSLGLDHLPRVDRLALAQALWDSVAAEGPLGFLSDERLKELERRADEDTASPDDVIPWEQVRDAARAGFRS